MNHFRHPIRYQLPAKRKQAFSCARWLKRSVLYGILIFITCSVGVVITFKYLPVFTSAFMLNKHVEDIATGFGYQEIQQQWVPAASISKYAFAAVIASEDQLFFQHNGFDFAAIQIAVNRYMQGNKLRGASTISQQVAKNLFLTPAKSFLRKGLEAWFTLLIEIFWSKSRILEVYLNVAEFGDHLYGIEAASRRYFGVSAKQLTAEQSALLAATLPNPLILQADQPSAYLYKRQGWILAQMRQL